VTGRIHLRGIFRPFPWLILLGLLLAVQARAEDPATLRVGTEIGFPPYADVDAEGRSTGFSVELFKSVAQATDLKAEYLPQPWSSAWAGLQRGEVDALPLVARLPMREGLVEFTKPHTIGYDTFFARKGQAAINTIEDARRLNIIVLRADAAHDVLVKQGFDRQLVPVDSLAQGFRLLASGQFDALLAPQVQGQMQVQMLGLEAAIEHGPVLREYRREFCFAVAKGNTQLRDRLERGLEIAKASGEYDRLYRKWLGIYEPKTFPRIYVFWAVAGLLGLVALLLLWLWTLRRQVEARTRELRQHQELLEDRVAERTAELCASETKFRLLVEQSPDGIFVADHTGHFIDVNAIGSAVLGYTREELLTLSIPDILVEEEHPRLPAVIASYADGSAVTSEWTFRRNDGSTFLGEVVGRQLPDGRLQGILRDIAERKRAEAEQQRLVSTLQATLESTADGLLVVDLEGRITGYNQQFTRLWQIPEAILSARDDNHVLAFVFDQLNDPEAFLAKVRQLYAAPERVYEDELEFKDGRIVERYSQPQWLEGRPAGRVWSFRDVTANRRATQALREADQRKDEFLAMLAHELRNPLAPIRNAASVLGLLNLDEPRVRWAQAIIERQVTHLTRLVDELLDVSRIARGKVTLHKAPIMLADLLRQVGESVQPVMAEKSHQFEMQSPAERVVLEGDIVRLVQVLQNLLNNAAKFTPEGGHIKLEARLQGEEIEIEVRDNGTGISANLLPSVFDLFRQGERTLDRSQGGLGIGLTLVQRLVEMHDGRVEAHSDGAGLGARFTVWLPVSRLGPANLTTTGEPAAIPSGLKILVVDDNPSVLESLVMLLELEGYQVRSAASGNTALKVLDVFWPQIVLLDIGMPEQDGYEVARQLRRLPGGEQLKLVAVSGYGHQEALTESQQAGFDTHLVKPYAANKLNLLLNRLSNQT
jgi:PAS domain S-box-containing protein